jgi:hypothetical protein
MYKRRLLLLVVFTSLLFANCMTDPSSEENEILNQDTLLDSPIDTVNNSVLVVKAKFLEFELNDASHYIFKDTAGNVWDFGGCEEKDYEFAMELQSEKQNEENQGWKTNPDLKNKWFEIKYSYRNQPKYQDGPVMKVPIILQVELSE